MCSRYTASITAVFACYSTVIHYSKSHISFVRTTLNVLQEHIVFGFYLRLSTRLAVREFAQVLMASSTGGGGKPRWNINAQSEIVLHYYPCNAICIFMTYTARIITDVNQKRHEYYFVENNMDISLLRKTIVRNVCRLYYNCDITIYNIAFFHYTLDANILFISSLLKSSVSMLRSSLSFRVPVYHNQIPLLILRPFSSYKLPPQLFYSQNASYSVYLLDMLLLIFISIISSHVTSSPWLISLLPHVYNLLSTVIINACCYRYYSLYHIINWQLLQFIIT